MIKKFNDYINEDFTDLYNRWKKKEVRKEDKTNAIGVDLGLPSGLLWADRNIDAEDYMDCGGYFSWGELKSKDKGDFTLKKYKFYKEKYILTKYNEIDKKRVIDECDDIAHYKIGNLWRIPTAKDFEELIKYTNSELIKEGNRMILKLSSKSNDNYICIPTNGFFFDGQGGGEHTNIMLRTSELDKSNLYSSIVFSYSSYTQLMEFIKLGRDCGVGVRGVCDKK